MGIIYYFLCMGVIPLKPEDAIWNLHQNRKLMFEIVKLLSICSYFSTQIVTSNNGLFQDCLVCFHSIIISELMKLFVNPVNSIEGSRTSIQRLVVLTQF